MVDYTKWANLDDDDDDDDAPVKKAPAKEAAAVDMTPAKEVAPAEMCQGAVVRLHRGSFCYVSTDGETYDESLCQVMSFNRDKLEWMCKWKGREVPIPETALRLCFSLLPSALDNLHFHHKIEFETAQGSCGRGLVAGEDIKQGSPIFEEPCLLVVYKSAVSPIEQHELRWRAYQMLKNLASRGNSSYKKAVAAFDQLGTSSVVPEHVRTSAIEIARVSPDPRARAASSASTYAEEIESVLMRFHCNQFSFYNGAPDNDPAFNASAVFSYTSRINHSCAPNMAMIRKYTYRKLHDLPTKLEADGGITMAVAARDIAKGERLTFSYDTTIAATRIYEKEKTVAAVPDQSLGVTHRRERLLNTLSFLCGCERCVADLADEKAAAKRAAVKGAAAKGAAAKGAAAKGAPKPASELAPHEVSSSETATHAVKALDTALSSEARSDVAAKADPPPTQGSVDSDGGGSAGSPGIINRFNLQTASMATALLYLVAAAAALALASVALATALARRRR